MTWWLNRSDAATLAHSQQIDRLSSGSLLPEASEELGCKLTALSPALEDCGFLDCLLCNFTLVAMLPLCSA
jgi:hypothetical protein